MPTASTSFDTPDAPPRVRRIFALALTASLLAHLALLAGPGLRLPADEPAPSLIEARLEPLPPPVPKPAPEAKPQPRPEPRPKPITRPVPMVSSTPQTTAPADEPTPIPLDEPAPVPLAPETAPPATSEPVAEAKPEEPAPPPPPPLNPMPSRAEIHYSLLKGTNGFSIGRAAYIWQMRGDRYIITGITEGTGLVALIFPGKLVQISQGRITPKGLEPDAFWIQRGRPTPDKTSSAHFDYKQQTVTLGKKTDATTVPMLPGAQDILSVTFQLAMTAPFQGEMLLHVTTAKALKPYRAHVVGEEMLDTPVGRLRTLHLARPQEAGEDAIDLWLAPDYNYMPVRMRVNHRKFGIVEQVISHINVEF